MQPKKCVPYFGESTFGRARKLSCEKRHSFTARSQRNLPSIKESSSARIENKFACRLQEEIPTSSERVVREYHRFQKPYITI